jgi:hypothetical protein
MADRAFVNEKFPASPAPLLPSPLAVTFASENRRAGVNTGYTMNGSLAMAAADFDRRGPLPLSSSAETNVTLPLLVLVGTSMVTFFAALLIGQW